MPYFAGPVADERDALLTFLGVPRAALRAAVFGLTDEQARSRPAASALCLGGLVKHAARTERRWVVAGIAGQPLPGQPLAVNPEQSLRWVLFHLIQETARHAGHADIIRETLDGRRGGQLLAAYEAG